MSMGIQIDDVVLACSDPEVVASYMAHCELETELRKEMVRLCHEKWDRDPWTMGGRARTGIVGLSVRPKDWSYEKAREAWVARGPEEGDEDRKSFWFSADRDDPVVIPDGFRKRVKDDFLTPPLKGSSPAIKDAQAFFKTWQWESQRGYMERVHGLAHLHFAGLRMVTCGILVWEGTVYVHSGKGYEQSCPRLDPRFQRIDLADYMKVLEAERAANPKDEDDDQ